MNPFSLKLFRQLRSLHLYSITIYSWCLPKLVPFQLFIWTHIKYIWTYITIFRIFVIPMVTMVKIPAHRKLFMKFWKILLPRLPFIIRIILKIPPIQRFRPLEWLYKILFQSWYTPLFAEIWNSMLFAILLLSFTINGTQPNTKIKLFTTSMKVEYLSWLTNWKWKNCWEDIGGYWSPFNSSSLYWRCACTF